MSIKECTRETSELLHSTNDKDLPDREWVCTMIKRRRFVHDGALCEIFEVSTGYGTNEAHTTHTQTQTHTHTHTHTHRHASSFRFAPASTMFTFALYNYNISSYIGKDPECRYKKDFCRKHGN